MKSVPCNPGKILLVSALSLLLLPSIAHAYLDPGTGSYVLQLLIGTVLGGLFAVGVFWRRVTGSIRRLFKRRSSDDGSR